MAKVKVKFTLNELAKDINREVARTGLSEVVDSIVEQISSGISPVKGFNRYKKYSDGYAKKKGVPQEAVTMIDTGEMLESLNASIVAGKLQLQFNDKKAQFHDSDSGANGVTRRLLPTRQGETFKQKILDKIVKAFNKAAESAVKKQK